MCFKGHFWELQSLHSDTSLGHLEVVENGQRWTSSIRQDLDDFSATGLPCSTFRVPEGVLADAAEVLGADDFPVEISHEAPNEVLKNWFGLQV